jgi:CRISPR-associated protein Csd1
MLLKRLREYADARIELPPTLYVSAPVRYLIELDKDGRLLNPEPVDTADPASPQTRRGTRRLVPQVTRAVGIKPLLLADNSEYTFGLARETSRPERVRECQRAYLSLVERCATETRAPEVGAVHRFLESSPIEQLRLPDDFYRGATLTFGVCGLFVFFFPEFQEFWARENDPTADDATIMQ